MIAYWNKTRWGKLDGKLVANYSEKSSLMIDLVDMAHRFTKDISFTWIMIQTEMNILKSWIAHNIQILQWYSYIYTMFSLGARGENQFGCFPWYVV